MIEYHWSPPLITAATCPICGTLVQVRLVPAHARRLVGVCGHAWDDSTFPDGSRRVRILRTVPANTSKETQP